MKYYLIENPLVEGKYYAKVIPSANFDEEQLKQHMMAKNTGQSESDINAVLTLRKNSIIELTSQGNYVNDGLAQYRPDIKGSFDEEGDSYDGGRHQIKVDVIPTVGYNKSFRDISVEKVNDVADRTNPIPTKFIDHGSDTINEVLTPGSIGQLTGRRLKIDPEASDEGLFFIAEDNTETRVATLVKNNPSELIFSVPELPAGFYSIQVRNRYNRATQLRTGEIKAAMEVLEGGGAS